MSKTNKKIKKILRQKRTEDFEILSIENKEALAIGYLDLTIKGEAFGEKFGAMLTITEELWDSFEDEKMDQCIEIISEMLLKHIKEKNNP